MSCAKCSEVCSCGPSALAPGCTPGGPPPTAPVAQSNTQPLESLACSILGSLQPAIDIARRNAHSLGARPYRVRLVWQEQDSITGKWSEVYSLELVPVRIIEGRENLEDLAPGQAPSGQISLREVSPAQVDEATLRGYLNGSQWTDVPTREFFFEVQQLPQCAGDPEPERYRYVLAKVPELRAASHEWRVSLVAQFGRRDRDGSDATVPGEPFAPIDGARFMG